MSGASQAALHRRMRFHNHKGRRAHKRLLALQAAGKLDDTSFRILKRPYILLPGMLWERACGDPDSREGMGVCRDVRCVKEARHPGLHRGSHKGRAFEWMNEGHLRAVCRRAEIPYDTREERAEKVFEELFRQNPFYTAGQTDEQP
jgi:hypothetical protein